MVSDPVKAWSWVHQAIPTAWPGARAGSQAQGGLGLGHTGFQLLCASPRSEF